MNNSEMSMIESVASGAGQPDVGKEVFFRDIGLKVGDRLIVEPPPKLGDQPGTVKLIGYVNDLSVLVTMPDTRPWAGPPIEGDEFTVRAFSGRHAYGFSTTVGKRAVSPFEYLHLQFPRRITVRQIRNAERIATSISARILDAAEPISTVVTNLSATGAEVRAWEPARVVGDSISLELILDIHKVRTRVVVSAVIRNAHQLADSGESAYGVQFTDVNAQTNIFLKSFVYQNLVEQPHKRL
ncbi:MAG: flagellar brake protein [Methyloversatilis sp.]|jgi:c-di-GMP-binding flagellar brake protein YcgR|nr:flagellar brake protein [Methyloversatilis sp.]MBP6194542.1 flagellar brake protein [Methyloversatilis sp.]MBP9116995.1 flagellar brake protein [Methyloversatilis sp.]